MTRSTKLICFYTFPFIPFSTNKQTSINVSHTIQRFASYIYTLCTSCVRLPFSFTFLCRLRKKYGGEQAFEPKLINDTLSNLLNIAPTQQLHLS